MQPPTLTAEQQFELRKFSLNVEKMDLEQARFFLTLLYSHMLVREASYQELLQHQWNIEPFELPEVGGDRK